MKISRLIIKNYRNLKDIDICLGETVVLVGENNSGKRYANKSGES